MISSFFSKAKPIHFLVISIFLLIAFVFSKFFIENQALSITNIATQIGTFTVCIFSIFVLNFLSGKNDLTHKNSYNILFITLFMVMLPQTFCNIKIVIANFFVLLAFRRIISLRTQKELKKKLFDAAFWISLATLLFFWASLFYLLIFAALFLYAIPELKNWAIPFIGVLAAICITVCVLIIADTTIISYFSEMDFGISFNYSTLNSPSIITALTIVFTYFVWSLFHYIGILKTKARTKKPTSVLVVLAALIALAIVVISPEKTSAEFLFLLAPLSVIVTNYMETVSVKWFKETLIWLLIITPIIGLML